LIVDNYFDSPYIYGTTETLIELPTGSNTSYIVERNINQTGYLALPLTNGLRSYANDTGYSGTAPSLGTGSSTFYHNQSAVLWGSIPINTLSEFGWQENIDKYLPNNVKIITVKFGVKCFNHTAYHDSKILLFLNKYATNNLLNTDNYTNLDYLITLPSGPTVGDGTKDTKILNDGIDSSYSIVTGDQLNATTNTIYLEINAITGDFITGQNYGIGLSMETHIKNVSLVDPLNLYISPVIVKYRW
jgi:hypothetical protein